MKRFMLGSIVLTSLAAFAGGCTATTSPPPPAYMSSQPQSQPPPPQPLPPAAPIDTPPPAPTFNSTGWVLLGSQTVEGKRDHDVFPVGKQDGRFDKLTLVIADSDVDVASCLITFGNGSTFEPPLKQFFREGQRSRAIDLPGNDRFIRSVELRYGNTPGGGKARVEIWAKNTRR